MATFTPVLNLIPLLPQFNLPTTATTSVSPFAMIPPPPLPQTTFGSTTQTSYST
jgi:hypothetical protein